MSTPAFRLFADLHRPQAEPAIRAITRAKAREIVDRNPTATLLQLVELAWLEGRIEGIREQLDTPPEVLPVYDHSYCCQRCGRKVRLESHSPDMPALNGVCQLCTSEVRP